MMRSFTPHLLQITRKKILLKPSKKGESVHPSPFSKGEGFTLVETLVAIAIFILIIGALTGYIMFLFQTHNYTWQQSVAIDEGRQGIKTMVREIREARSGDDGSFVIEKASDKEFIFYSDIDGDGKTERVRYFLGNLSSESQTKECTISAAGGSCGVTFSNFFQGVLKSAIVKVSVEGDLGSNSEYAEIFADSQKLGDLCKTSCSDCAGTWQGITTFDVISQASDNDIQFLAEASYYVGPNCPHAMKARFEFSFTAEVSGAEHELKKGVIEPISLPIEYPRNQEEISIVSSYIRNAPPIFEYFDKDGNKIEESPARLIDTKLMKIFLVVNVDPDRPPQDFELESYVQPRNLKEE